jgi:hypothetical protein
LEQYPVLNATISEDESNITYVADHNISVAIDTPRGLLVPNIKAVQVRGQQRGSSTPWFTDLAIFALCISIVDFLFTIE